MPAKKVQIQKFYKALKIQAQAASGIIAQDVTLIEKLWQATNAVLELYGVMDGAARTTRPPMLLPRIASV